MTDSAIDFLLQLERLLEERKGAQAKDSYTASLYQAGAARIAQKLGEEAVELAIASVQGDHRHIVSESADLLFHLLVLLRSHAIDLRQVVDELKARHRAA